MSNRNDKNRVRFDRIDQTEWKAVEKHSSQPATDFVSKMRMFTEAIDAELHISEKTTAQPVEVAS